MPNEAIWLIDCCVGMYGVAAWIYEYSIDSSILPLLPVVIIVFQFIIIHCFFLCLQPWECFIPTSVTITPTPPPPPALIMLFLLGFCFQSSHLLFVFHFRIPLFVYSFLNCWVPLSDDSFSPSGSYFSWFILFNGFLFRSIHSLCRDTTIKNCDASGISSPQASILSSHLSSLIGA